MTKTSRREKLFLGQGTIESKKANLETLDQLRDRPYSFHFWFSDNIVVEELEARSL